MKSILCAALLLLTANVGHAGESAPMPPSFDINAAERFANLALACVHKEYPNKISHNWPWPSILPACKRASTPQPRAPGEGRTSPRTWSVRHRIHDRGPEGLSHYPPQTVCPIVLLLPVYGLAATNWVRGLD